MIVSEQFEAHLWLYSSGYHEVVVPRHDRCGRLTFMRGEGQAPISV